MPNVSKVGRLSIDHSSLIITFRVNCQLLLTGFVSTFIQILKVRQIPNLSQIFSGKLIYFNMSHNASVYSTWGEPAKAFD